MVGVFVWQHVFQSGDLPIYFAKPSGPIDPYSVSYTFKYTPKGSECPIVAGPSNRTPVRTGVGEYYATGIAGQCGQPGGTWVICWQYQETLGSPTQEVCQTFVVFDSSTYCAPSCTPSQDPCGCGPSSPCSPSYGWG